MSIAPCRTTLRKASGAVKRPHSPEPMADTHDHSSKRVKTTLVAPVVQESPTPLAASRAEAKKERERKKEKERLAREEEFKVKYTRAFPNWVFHFDFDACNSDHTALRSQLEKRLTNLNARVEDFFSNQITHLITVHDVDDKENKEKSNGAAAGGGQLLSPIKLRGRAHTNSTTTESRVVQQARSFNMKIWSAAKLSNVLDRCDAPRGGTGTPSAHAQQTSKERSLARMLQSERLHGTTERDPTQRRHDYIYFSKDSYFVLVEDLRGELATIAVAEYQISRGKDGKERGAWPVLHCHPLARGPFLEYDEREERRRQKTEKAEKERQAERARRKARLVQNERKRRAQQVRMQAAQQHDLRRCASMNNLQRRATFPDPSLEGLVDLDADFPDDHPLESVNASGYLASGAYMAASGNSVSVTSTTGTTSAAGSLLRTLQLPARIKEKMQRQVSMPRRAPAAPPVADMANKENIMGPPPTIPDRAKFLRKSKSTNTLKLPKRDEASKPGYCESCRVKFEDFRDHIASRKHRKFAMDDNNFKHLDAVLSRVKRRTVDEVREANAQFLAQARASAKSKRDDDESMTQVGDGGADDVHWDEWVDAGKCEVEV
ncbi:Dfp1/Him1, central region-domain-containing protein [Earliella scabrosa]|nr:Dfp1/Him1, central region-domain-containing protein [Earliella scabrosa]